MPKWVAEQNAKKKKDEKKTVVYKQKPQSSSVSKASKVAKNSTFLGGGASTRKTEETVKRKQPSQKAQRVATTAREQQAQRISKNTTAAQRQKMGMQTSEDLKRAKQSRQNVANTVKASARESTSDKNRGFMQRQKSGTLTDEDQRRVDRTNQRRIEVAKNTGTAAKKGVQDAVTGYGKTLADIDEMAKSSNKWTEAKSMKLGIDKDDTAGRAKVEEERQKSIKEARRLRLALGEKQDARQAAWDKRTKNAKGIEKAWYGAVESGTGMLTDMAVGALTGTGQVGSLASMGFRTYGTTRGQAQKEGATENEDRLYSLLQAGKEVGTELMFQGAGLAKKAYTGGRAGLSVADRVANSLTKGMTGRKADIVGAGVRLLGGTAEENVEELAGWVADPVIKELTYGKNVRTRQAKAVLKQESDELRSQIQSAGDAQAVAAYLSSDRFIEQNVEQYKEAGLSDKQAREVAEQMREYLTASLTGDTDRMAELEKSISSSMAGSSIKAALKDYDKGELMDTFASTSLLTLTTGLPATATTAMKGAQIREDLGSDGIRALSETAINFEDGEASLKAQVARDRIDSGKELTSTQVYDLAQAQAQQIEKDAKRVYAAANTADKGIQESNYVTPRISFNEDGSVAGDEIITMNYVNESNDATEIISGLMKEEGSESLTDTEVQNGSRAIAGFKTGAFTVNDANALNYTNTTVRTAFEQATGIDLSQYVVKDRNGGVNIPETNAATKDALFAMAADNFIKTAEAETNNWMDSVKGQVVTEMSGRMGAQGSLALQQALDDVDERDRTTYMTHANAAEMMYQAARNMGTEWDSVKAEATRMFPGVSEQKLEAMYNAGLQDRADAANGAIGQQVKIGEAMSLNNEPVEPKGKVFVDTEATPKGSIVRVFSEIASNLGIDIHLVDDLKTSTGGQANGQYINGSIYINMNSDFESNIGYIFMHEVTHHLKLYAPEQFNELENLVREKWFKYNPEQMQNEIAKRIDLYKRNGQTLSEEEALEEIIADAAHEFINDRNFANQVAEQNPDIAKAILNGIRNALRMLRRLFASGSIDDETHMNSLFSQLDILDEAEKLWLNAYTQAVRNKAAVGIDEWQEKANKGSQARGSISGDGLVIRDGNARWTDERIDRLIRENGASNQDYSQAYAALMNPRDYLKLTLSDEMLDRWNKGSNDPAHPETYSLNEEELRDEYQTPFLTIYSNDGTEVQGHEGRHRMRALMEAGVTSVPVVIRDTDTKYSKEHTESMTLTAQDFGYDPVNNGAAVTITDLVPIKESNRDELIQKFGGEAQVRFSLTPVEPVQPSSDAWKSGANFAEVKAAHPTLFEQDTDQEEQSADNDKRHLTQVKNTVSTYNKIYDMLGPDFEGTILDASSGLGEGTRSGRENYGFDVDDIEPYPDKNYKPRYMDYSTLDKQYDVVISNAVLNVLTQDDRDAMVNHIGKLLKPGGRAFINVRGSDVLNAKNKIAIDESNLEYFIPKTSKSGYYQKGFTPKELKAYLEDALGPGFTVENTTKFGKSAAIVTKSMDTDARFSLNDPANANDYAEDQLLEDSENTVQDLSESDLSIRYSFGPEGTFYQKGFHSKGGTNVTGSDVKRKKGNPLLESGKDILAQKMKKSINAELKKQGISTRSKVAKEIANARIESVMNFMDAMNNFMEETGLQYTFIGMQDVHNAKIFVRKTNDGIQSITMSAMVKNGEYPINFDFTTICKKRQAFNAIIEKLTDESAEGADISLSPKELGEINNALRKEGLETACLGCFVEARRYNMQNYTNKVCDLWNKCVDDYATSIGIDPADVEDFNFANGEETTEAKFQDAADTFFAYENTTAPKKNPEDRFRHIIRSSQKAYMKHLHPADLITSNGIQHIKDMSTKGKDFFGMLKSAYGVAAPKETIKYVPYNSEVALLPENKGKNKDGSTQTMLDYLKSIGGIRMQSFSDYLVANTFDYMQMVADMAARGFPAHAYTKEIAFARVFGMTGIKINLSIMYDVQNMNYWRSVFKDASDERIREIAAKYAGLQYFENVKDIPEEFKDYDKDGNLILDHGSIMRIDEDGVKGYLTYLVGDENRSQRYWKEVYSQVLEETGDQAQAEEQANETRKWIQSINFKEAKELQGKKGYGRNCGMIGVGLSDANILLMLNDDNMPYIIPYHASGLPDVIKQHTGLNFATNYEDTQNTRIFVSFTKDGEELGYEYVRDLKDKLGSWQKAWEKVSEEIRNGDIVANGRTPRAATDKTPAEVNKDGNPYVLHGTADFDFYEKLDNGATPQEAAEMYLEYCDEYGLLPVFPQFAGHPNYYKLLVDYSVTDLSNNKATSPQGAVKNIYPGSNGTIANIDQGSTDYEGIQGILEDEFEKLNKKNKHRDEVVDKLVEDWKRKDIRHSISPEQDSDGNILTDDQMEYFKNSQARDAQGRLVPVYHVTPMGGFTIFDPAYSSDQKSISFTNDMDFALNYSSDDEDIDAYRIAYETRLGDGETSGIGHYKTYLNMLNPYIVDGSKIVFNDEVEEITAYAQGAGYDGVIMRNFQDMEADIYQVFSSPQIKDTRNENPSENPDIRYSITPEDEAMSHMAADYAYDNSYEALAYYESIIDTDASTETTFERAKKYIEKDVDEFYAGLTRYADGMKFDDPVLEEGRVRMAKSKQDYFNSNKTKWNQNWLTEGEVLDIKSVKKAVRDLVIANMQNSDTDRKYRAELVDKMLIDMRLAYFYAKQGRTDIADALLWHSAFRMVDGVGFYDDDGNYETYKKLRDYFKDTKLRLGDDYWKDVDYAAFRKRNYGKLNLVKGETNIDKIFGDLYEVKEDGSLGGIAPEYFTPEAFEKNDHKFGSVPDTLLQIEDVLLELEPYAEAYSSEYCADWATSLASDLLDIMSSGKEVQSIADKYTNKYEARIKAMKARHAEAMLKTRQNYKEKYEAEIADLKLKQEQKYNALKRKADFEIATLKQNREYNIQRLKAERERAVKEERQKGKWKEAERRERLIHNKHFQSIQKTHKKLTERLLNNTADSNIPQQYKKELAKLLAAFDFQTEASKKREMHYGKDGYVRRDISQKTLQLEAIRTTLKNIENKTSEFHIADAITDIMDDLMGADTGNGFHRSIEGLTIDELSVSELARIDKLLKALLHEFNTYRNVKIGAKRQQTADIGKAQVDSALEHADKFGQGIDYQNIPGAIDRILNLDEMTPAYLFRRIDPNKEGLGLMFRELRRGFDKYVRNQNQLNDWMDEIVGKYHKKSKLPWRKYGAGELENWRSENYAQTFNLQNGPVTLTPAQMMSLYCLSKRAQAYNHMTGAGIVVAPVSFNAKIMSDIKKKADMSLPVILTDADIHQIVTALTPEQIKVAEDLQKLMAEKMAAWGNEASMNVLGIELFGEPDYFPIKSDKAALEKDLNDNEFVEAIRNFGFTKAVQPGARNAIMVDDIFNVVTEHCNNMNLYNAYSEAMNDFMKVYNYRDYREDGREYTVQQAIAHAYSKKATTFIMTFMRDLNGNVSGRASGIENFYNSMLGNAKKAAVFANFRVAAQQPTAITRAFAVIDPKYLKGIKIEKGAMDELFEHCPIALWKSWGYYDINMGKSIEDIMMNNGRWLEDAATDFYGSLDNVTWAAIWQMVKAETKDTHPDVKEGSDEFWDLCNERMTEVVDLTQVVDSPFHRSHAMRDKGFLAKTATSFMAEPTLTFNMIKDGYVRSREAWKSGNKDEAAKIAARTGAVALLQAATVAGAAALIDALRKKKPDKDDEDDSFLHLWWVNALENFKGELELWNKIYFVKDIASIFDGWENSNLALQGIQKVALGYRQLTGDKYARSSAAWYENMADGLGYLFGVPVKTMRTGLKNAMGFMGVSVSAIDSAGEKLDSLAKQERDADIETEGMAGKLLGMLLSDDGDKTLLDKYAERKGYKKKGSKDDADTDSTMTPEELHASVRETLDAFDEKYNKLGEKAAEKAAGLSGKQRDEALWDVIAEGYTKSVDAGNLATIQRMRDEFEEQGGDITWFDAKITDAMKSAYKKTLYSSSDPAANTSVRQAMMHEYLTDHGVSETEISDICYHSALAKDLKAAMRIGNEDYIMDELVPLIQAGLTREDYEKLYKYRNYGANKYDGKYTDPKYTKTTGTFIWPTDGVITSHFGYRDSPTAGASSNHPAIDIGAPMGSTVVAADGGVVITAGWNGGYGNSVGIKHSNGMVTYYNHLSAWNVKVGDQVGQGQQIAAVGSTGISTGPHLDFKILDANGTPVDPEKYLNKRQ